MARSRDGRQLGINLPEKTTQQALAGKQLGDKVAHMSYFYLRRFNICIGHGLAQGLCKHLINTLALARPVAGKVSLAAAQNIYVAHVLMLLFATDTVLQAEALHLAQWIARQRIEHLDTLR